MCATIGVTLILALVMARQNKSRDAQQLSSTRGDGRAMDMENEKAAIDSGLDRDEHEGRDVSDGQNRSFRYIL